MFIRYMWGVLLCSLILSAVELSEKYTAYRYVFDEFDVESTYIDNSDFRHFVSKHEKGLRRFYMRSVKQREDLARLLRQKLLEDDLSDLFLYLSIVESGLRTDAVSNKKAAGLWQFMPKTAGDYKLEVHGCVDERCDPVSATEAAIKHLRRLYEKFGKWYLAVLAYNCGEGRLSRAIERAGTDELEILIDPQAKYLPKETREYIQKILLVAMIGEDEIVSVTSSDEEKGLIQVEVKGGTKLADIAKMLEMSEKKLRMLNPALKSGVVPSRYRLLIPEDKMVLFYMRYAYEEKQVTLKPYLISHKVILGNTLEGIAKKYETTVEEIALANQLKGLFLEVNTTLLVPVNKEVFERFLQR